MQNTVYECKQNGEDFFLSLAVTYSRFGNSPANGLVTEQPQYSVIICIFSTWQNAEIKLISNGLRFIFTCPLFLAQPITFHCFRHTYATLQMAMSSNPYVVSQALTHKNLETTLRYTHEVPTALLETLGKIKIKPK